MMLKEHPDSGAPRQTQDLLVKMESRRQPGDAQGRSGSLPVWRTGAGENMEIPMMTTRKQAGLAMELDPSNENAEAMLRRIEDSNR